jgi:CheY-like chemotaxis protein
MFRVQQLEEENRKLRTEIMEQLQKSIELLTDGQAVLTRIAQNQQQAIKDLQKRVRKLELSLQDKNKEEEVKKP